MQYLRWTQPSHFLFEPHSKSRVYQTWIIFSSSYGFHCWAQVVRTTAIQPVQDQSNPIYIVKSENYGKSPYYPRRVQYFNIQCPSRGYIQTMTTDLERRTKLTIGSSSTYYCADYVQIDYKSQGRCEMCGNETVSSNGCPPYFYSDGINITFRTSQFNNYKGFSMTVVCYEGSEQDLPGCIQTLPAWTEKSTTGQGDSQEYYSIVRKYTRAVNAVDHILSFLDFRIRSIYLLMPKMNSWTFTKTTSSLLTRSQVRDMLYTWNHAHFYRCTIQNDAWCSVVEDHYNTLRLAVLSENSCSAVLRSIGREVAEMFPAVMVMQAKINGSEVAMEVVLSHYIRYDLNHIDKNWHTFAWIHLDIVIKPSIFLIVTHRAWLGLWVRRSTLKATQQSPSAGLYFS